MYVVLMKLKYLPRLIAHKHIYRKHTSSKSTNLIQDIFHWTASVGFHSDALTSSVTRASEACFSGDDELSSAS